MASYLSNRYLFVVANGQEFSYIQLQQGCHRVVFGHQCYVRHFHLNLINSCLLVSYADESILLKVIPTKDLRLTLIYVEMLIGEEGGSLNLNLQSPILFLCLLNIMLKSIPLYLGMMC